MAPGADADFDEGRRVGKYEILTRLSVGGMAELFLAFTSGPGGFRKFVALKQILPDIKKDPNFVKMFLDEARITAALTHANIGQVFDLGQDQGELYLAMEFIAGQNLERTAKIAAKQGKAIPIGFSARVVRDTCLGLHYAHNFVGPGGKPSPVIHRDVSPKNVMVNYEGVTKVIDFGIAKAKGKLGRTQVGIVKGTSGYMSPEQVKGEALDGRSDLFAAGVMLHELITGQRLFVGSSEAAMMVKIAEEDSPDPRELNPEIPEALAEVALKALAKPRGERFATGKEMARAIDAALGREVFDDEQAAHVMQELFADRMAKTRELLDAATRSEDARQLGEVAGALREEEPPSRPKRTPPGRAKVTGGANRYASSVAQSYAIHEQSDSETVQDASPQGAGGGATAIRPAPRPAGVAKKSGWGGRIALIVTLLGLAGVGVSTRAGPLQPVVGPLAGRIGEWFQKEMAGEPPPPPPQPLKRTALPAQAISLIEKEKAAAEEQKHRAEVAAAAPDPDPIPPPPATASSAKRPAGPATRRPSKPADLPNTTVTQHPDGEAEVLDTHDSRSAAKDGLGWLSLFTVPPAQVYDGATNLGVSPLYKVPLPAGTYRLRLVDPDGNNRVLSAPIKKGEVTTLKIQTNDLPLEK